MRVAIIGLPGAGKTTLAAVLARELGAAVVGTAEELAELVSSTKPFVLDGFPHTVAELEQLQNLSPSDRPLDHVIWLVADDEARAHRIRRSVAISDDPAAEAVDTVDKEALAELGARLETDGLLIPINADGIEFKVMALAFEALAIRI